MKDGFLCAFERLDGPRDQLRATWREDLDPHVIWGGAWCLYQAASEVEIGLRGRWIRDFNLLVAKGYQLLEVVPFLFAILQETKSAQ
jgi:hypothetical protein